jgi:aryl-alcohol dehydrogenase-like predicted oxidoreductase
MKYRTMPGIDRPISEVGFGVWSVATPWWGVRDDKLAKRLLRSAYEDYGITFYDTAGVYGQGKGETILAEALEGIKDQVVIATKFGYDIYTERGDHQSELPQRWDKESIRKACEESLKRLKIDAIDLCQLHNPRMEAIQSEEVIETLERLREEGKIRTYGVVLGPGIGWRDEGMEVIRRKMGMVQTIHNLLEQDPARELIKAAEKENVPVVTRAPHASGLLDGTYESNNQTDHRNHRSLLWMRAGLQVIRELKFLYEGTNRTLAQAAILFCLSSPTVKSVLPNITSEANLKEFAEASDKPPLTRDELKRIEELWEGGHKVLLKQPFSNSKNKPTPVTGR